MARGRLGSSLGYASGVRAPTGRKMTDEELNAFLLRKAHQAMNDDDGDVSALRADSFNAYMGREQGPDRDGHSTFTTRETLEVVEWTMPHIMRAFTASRNVVEFLPKGPDDEFNAKRETEIVNYYFSKRNDGFMAIYEWVKDALMQPVAYAKVYPKTTERKVWEKHRSLTEMELAQLSEEEGVEITSMDSRIVRVSTEYAPPPPQPQQLPPSPQPGPGGPPGMPPPGPQLPTSAPPGPGGPPMPPPPMPGMMGMMPPGLPAPEIEVEVYDVEVERVVEETIIQIDPLPPEEVLVDRDLTSLSLDKADSVIHRTDYTFTDLMEMGYSEEKLSQARTNLEQPEFQDERTNRLFYEDEDPDQWSEDDPSMRKYWLFESYVWVDYDGDGKSEFRKIVMVGGVILENEPVNYQPIIAMSSIPLSHKHNGTSYAEIVSEIQQVQTQIMRELLDNIYTINIRRKWLDERQITADFSTIDYLQQVDSEWIPVNGPPQSAVLYEPTTPIIADLLQAKDAMSEVFKMRTGVAPDLNVDPNVLQQSTAAAFTQAQSAAHQRTELLIRVLAETGIRVLFMKAHDLMRRYLDDDLSANLSNEWITVNPADWRDRQDVAVNVGLGHANRDQQMQVLMAILQEQKEALGMGLAKPEHIYATYERLVEAAGIGKAPLFFDNPLAPGYQPPPPPQPTPIEQAQVGVLTAQAQQLSSESQTKAMELQAKAQMEQRKAQIDGQKAMIELRKSEQDLRMAEAELEMKDAELRIKEAELQLKMAELEAKLAADIENVDADTVLKLSNAQKAIADAKVALMPQPAPQVQPDESMVSGVVAGLQDGISRSISEAIPKKSRAVRLNVRRGATGDLDGADIEYEGGSDDAD